MPAASEGPLEAARHRTYAYVGAFFTALAECGVEYVCASPGSRSTPLVVAAASTPGLCVVPIVDERSAGFFASGLARQSGRPVALVCTSGTAAANYLPAVVESHYARVPLIVLTADRPPELREWGAGQTIDQQDLYGRAVRRFVEMPVPSDEPSLIAHARVAASRAVGDASGAPPGPVHLNWPLREPLEPPATFAAPEAGASHPAARGAARVAHAVATPSAEDVAELAAWMVARPRGVIACGPLPPSTERDLAIAALARAAGWPVLADPLSGMRRGPHVDGAPVAACTDLWLRDAGLGQRFAPDAVLRIGDTPTSKAQRLWLEARPPASLVLVEPGDGWEDPSHLATRVVRADPATLCRAVAERIGEPRRDAAFRDGFLSADRRAAQAVRSALAAETALDEPGVVRVLDRRLPADASLFVSSSMPVRDLDAFLPASERPLRVLANRGANGIDGVTSSALGAAFAGRGPVVLLTGDLALLHDLGGLLAARSHRIPLVIVAMNNDGGGIFSFLPIAERGGAVDFERLFRTPHGLDLEHAARLFELGFDRVSSLAQLDETLAKRLDGSPDRAWLIEVPVDRDANVERFRRLARAAGEAASRGVDG